MKVVIVIPTYNEAENVVKLVPQLAEEIPNISHEVVTLFVDDSSPDGTAQILEGLKAKYHFVNIFVRKEKTGLGAAYIDGFKKAMNEMDADVIMEMDADLQHDPKDIKRFIKEIDNGFDFVMGSRYMKGGSVPKEWAFYRKLLSWSGNLFSKFALGIFSLTEFTNGFRATRVKGVLDQVDLDAIKSDGFAYKLDLLHKTYKTGAKMKEIPIVFGLRDRGISKMEQNNMIESLIVVLTIRYQESKRFVKFITVGFVGLGVDGTIFNVLRLTLVSSNFASAISGLFGMTTTFTLNNAWSFKDRKIESNKRKALKFGPYIVVSYIPIIFRSWLVGFSVNSFGDTTIVANIAFFVGVVIGTVWNFVIYSKIIWRKK